MWIELNESNIYSRLSAPEVEALKGAATDRKQAAVIPEVIGMVVENWRAVLRKHHSVSIGATIPEALEVHVLADIRYRLFTRLPDMGDLLDELRVDEWKEAMRVLNSGLKNYVFDDPPEVPGAGVEVASSSPRRFTPRKMTGL